MITCQYDYKINNNKLYYTVTKLNKMKQNFNIAIFHIKIFHIKIKKQEKKRKGLLNLFCEVLFNTS